MKTYLEKELGRKVTMVTAPTFLDYLYRSGNGDYHIYHTAPHFAAYAESQYAHKRLARFSRNLDGSILVRKKDNIKHISELEGKKIATPDRLAVISMLGKIYLSENGLVPGKNVSLHHTESHGNAILAVAKGAADAAIVSAAVYERMPDDIKSRLTILSKTGQIPHVMLMAKKQLPDKLYRKIKKSLLAFTADSHGREFFENSRRGDMVEIKSQDMEALKPYVELLKEQLK